VDAFILVHLPNPAPGEEYFTPPDECSLPGPSSTARRSCRPTNRPVKASEEVMALFREMKSAGQTVVIITHNPENGGYADRTIHLKDGIVVDS
jgi:hypothetical protein